MFTDLRLLLLVHAIVGSSALVSFWVAALSTKGSWLHIRAGRVYLISMLLVLITALPIVLHFIEQHDYKRAMTLAYLFCVTLSGMFLLYRPMRLKRILDQYRNKLYTVWASFMTLFAGFIFYLSISNPLVVKKVLLFGFSSIGFFIGISMLIFSFTPARKNWWLNQHLNGAMVVFAATHASFLGLGLRKLIPALAGDWMHTVTQVGVIFTAYFLRWYLSPDRMRKTDKKVHKAIVSGSK